MSLAALAAALRGLAAWPALSRVRAGRVDEEAARDVERRTAAALDSLAALASGWRALAREADASSAEALGYGYETSSRVFHREALIFNACAAGLELHLRREAFLRPPLTCRICGGAFGRHQRIHVGQSW